MGVAGASGVAVVAGAGSSFPALVVHCSIGRMLALLAFCTRKSSSALQPPPPTITGTIHLTAISQEAGLAISMGPRGSSSPQYRSI
jgi:hypothetical protein